MKATASDASIATDAPTGIGRMYGPMSPLTNAIGRMAAMTVNVARIVGFPTSSTPSTAARSGSCPPFAIRCRYTFSTTTIASSTRIPIEKMRANSVIRLSEYPIA